jgi:hypothetical protein
MKYVRLISLGIPESKAKSQAALLKLLLSLQATTLYTAAFARNGLFGWEVVLPGWDDEEV